MSDTRRHEPSGRYARDDSKHAFFAGIVERCTDAMIAAVGESNVAAIFMTGAPSRGEATIVKTAGKLYSLSDVDLVCIASPAADLGTARAAAANAVARLNRELADVCVGVDATVKPHEYAGHLPALIANYEFVRTPALLWGDAAARDTLGEVNIDDIPADDALRFVHNRCIERLLVTRTGATADDDTPTDQAPVAGSRTELDVLRSYYSTAKLMLDLVTAFLFARRHVPIGYEERVRLFIDDYCERAEFGALAEEADPFIEELPLWAAFKTTGDAGALRAALPENVLAGAHAAPFAMVMWKRVLGDALCEDLSLASLPEALDRLAALEGPARSLVRSVKTLRSGRRRAIFPAGIVLQGALRASPVARAYLTGLLLFFSGFGGAASNITDLEEHEHHAGPIGGPTLNGSREWTRAALARYAPFSLPTDFPSMTDGEMRQVLLSRLARFHNEILLGRIPADDGAGASSDEGSTEVKAD